MCQPDQFPPYQDAPAQVAHDDGLIASAQAAAAMPLVDSGYRVRGVRPCACGAVDDHRATSRCGDPR